MVDLKKLNSYELESRIKKIEITGNGLSPAYDETNIIFPLDCFLKIGATSLANRNAALTFTSKILSHASSGQSNTDPTVGLTAAFDTRISIFP